MSTGIELISQVWDKQGKGYACISGKTQKGTWFDEFFKWPQEKGLLQNYVDKNHKKKTNVYWCPTLLTKPKRIKENVKSPIDMLWADLDEADPNKIQHKPSVSWMSSPGRYQALWFLSEELPKEQVEVYNKRMSYFSGADKGGWDLSQVLRIPGLKNFKYPEAPKGKLLWSDFDNTLTINQLKALPEVTIDEVEVDEDIPWDDEAQPEVNQSLLGLLHKYSQEMDKRIYELLLTPPEDVEVGERSERLWELECRLAEIDVPIEDIIRFVRLSPWNKFEGRRDERKRITTEVMKAQREVTKKGGYKEQQSVGFADKEWVSYDKFMSHEIKDPGWLIEGIWQKNSHGFIAGEPKTYKSVLATDLLVSVASNTPFLNKFEVLHSGPVLYIQEENSPWTVQDRIRKLAHARGLLHGKVKRRSRKSFEIQFPPILPMHFLNNKGMDLTNPECLQVIEEKVSQVKPILIVFDPLYLMLGGKDENSAKDLRPILNWLLEIRYKYGTAVIVLHHWNKGGKSERGGQRMLGSATFHGWVESAMYCRVLDEVEHKIAVEREFRSYSKRGPLEIKFTMDDPGGLKYEVEVSENSKEVQKSDILDLLTGTPGLSEKEIAKALGMTTKQVQNRLGALEAKGLVTGEGGGKGRGKAKIWMSKQRVNANDSEGGEGTEA